MFFYAKLMLLVFERIVPIAYLLSLYAFILPFDYCFVKRRKMREGLLSTAPFGRIN